MGGGDLNMKKSWHPLLLKNQEQVWLKEKQALEEKKKLEQLRKEKEEERQLQELQRLQEEQTGKKRTEKLEWMYATPATGSNQNPNDLEDYLLGKKRVDKILTGDENAKIGAAHKNFIAVQNANTVRDITSKIREDPLLAIKQQEQAAYQALMSNPLRLKQMQERNGIKPKKDKKEKKKEKEERKRARRERQKERDSRSRSKSYSPDRRHSPSYDSYSRLRRSRSPLSMSPRRSYDDDWRGHDHHSHQRRNESRSPNTHARRRNASRSLERDHHRSDSRNPRAWSRIDESDEYENSSKRRDSIHRNRNYRHLSPERQVKRPRSPSPSRFHRDSYDKRPRIDSPPRHSSQPSKHLNSRVAEDRTTWLAAMTHNAVEMDSERQERLAKMLEIEKAERKAEERARAKSKGMGDFLSYEQKKVFGGVGGLEDRIRRNRGAMVVDAD